MTTSSPSSHSPRHRSVLLAALVLAFAAPLVSATGSGGTDGAQIVFGGDASGAPFEYLDTHGNPAGFDVEVLRRAASHAGLALSIHLGNFDEQMRALRDGRIDVLMLPRTPDREGHIEFLAQTWTVRDVIAFRDDRDRYPSALQDLAAEVVAVTRHSERELALRLLPPGRRPAILLANSPAELVTFLAEGKASAIVGNALSIEHYGSRDGLRMVEVPEGRVPYWLATRLGHGSRPELQRLAQAVTTMRESGELGELVELHLGTAIGGVDWRVVRSRLLTTGLAACTLLAGALVWTWSLRQQVHQKTSALRAALASAEGHLQELQRTTAALQEHQEQLAAMRDQALEATAAKSAFLAVMSHELRTPLNGVIGMTTLLLDSPLTHEQRDQVETVRQCSALLLEQVNEVLDFSRVEAGKLELETAPFELRGLLEDTLQIVAERAQAKGLELMLDTDASLPPAVIGDAGRVRQVLLNLLGNAIKFTERGDVVLSARAVSVDRLEFAVCDTGIGIGPDEMPRLFQPFSQADRSTTRRFGGTGLGLAICRQFVLLMGGEIAVESVVGEGSRFWFTAVLPETEPLDAPLPVLPGGSRALCIDDHPRHRAILAAMLDRANVAVDTVPTLQAAVDRLSDGPPVHVVLLDAELEGAARWLPRAAPTMPPIVALTADAARLSASPHWAAILPRPVREPLLVATVGRVLGVSPSQHAGRPTTEVVAQAPPPLPRDLLVLVVDDNAVNQRVASRSLEKLGCRVDTAANGREAVEAALRTPYALILMDCQMPEMDGYEATRQLRSRQSPSTRTPIVAMTAGARAEDREACLACGMDDYLAKPFTLPDLRRMVAQWTVKPVGD